MDVMPNIEHPRGTCDHADVGGPRFIHNCCVVGGFGVGVDDDACRFIGRCGKYDLYIHVREWGVEVVARFGHEDPEYVGGGLAKWLVAEALGLPRETPENEDYGESND